MTHGDPAYGDYAGSAHAQTVVCPKGHANESHYKFCGECGAPIGLVAWPTDDVEPATTPTRSRTLLLIGAAVVVVIVVAAAAVAVVLTQPFGNDGEEVAASRETAAASSPQVRPTCPGDPLLEAESMDLTAEGLTVDVAFLSSCGGDDIESNSALEVTVADGVRDVASGSFDFSSDPLSIESGVPARRTLVFPPGMYWRTPDMLSGAPELMATRAGDSGEPAAQPVSGSDRMVAAAPAKPAYGSVDGVAEAVLIELRDADYSTVRGSLSNRWVPQVSSKRVGLVVDGKTYTNADILRDHLALRQRFRGARLVWSGHWTTFDDPNFWVTVVGPSLPTAQAANYWCDSQGFGVNDCFAKFISTFFDVEGTTVYRK